MEGGDLGCVELWRRLAQMEEAEGKDGARESSEYEVKRQFEKTLECLRSGCGFYDCQYVSLEILRLASEELCPPQELK